MDVYTYVLYGFPVILAGMMMVALLDYAVGVAVIWDGMKYAIRDAGYRLVHPGYSLDHPAVVQAREPDWADAADEVGFFDPIDQLLLNVSAWTPEEREAYGVNATDRLIDAIDDELKGWEWEQISSRRTTPPLAMPLVQRETASEKAIRRNGAQITASVIDSEKVWAGPAPAINTTQILR